jgi:hypothetical protein
VSRENEDNCSCARVRHIKETCMLDPPRLYPKPSGPSRLVLTTSAAPPTCPAVLPA